MLYTVVTKNILDWLNAVEMFISGGGQIKGSKQLMRFNIKENTWGRLKGLKHGNIMELLKKHFFEDMNKGRSHHGCSMFTTKVELIFFRY